MKGIALAAAATWLLAAPAQTAEMYKCVDERGVTHYTEKPPPGCKGARQVTIKPVAPPSGQERAPGGDLKGADREFQRRQIDRARAEEAEAQKAAAQKRRCASLRAEQGILAGGTALYRTNERGERVYLEDQARQQRAAELQAEIARLCP